MVISENLIYMQVLVLYQSILILRTIHSGRHRKVVIKFRALSRIPTSIIYKRFLGTTCTQNSNYFSLCDESRKLIPRSHTKFSLEVKKNQKKGRGAQIKDQARIQKFFKGGGVKEEIFERKMFVDTRINACIHKNQTNMQLFLSSSFSRGLSSIFCFGLLLSYF